MNLLFSREPIALSQESPDKEEIPVSGEDEQCDPDEDPTSADQMTAPEPTEPQECLQPHESESDSGEDSRQTHESLTEQGEPPETGEELQPEGSSSPGETTACEEGSDGEQGSEVTQLMHDGEMSTTTEAQIEESSDSSTETEGTKTCQTSECVESGEVEETGLDTSEHIEETEELKCLGDQPEVENMEEASLPSEEMEQSLGAVESEPSGTELAVMKTEHMEETMEGGHSVETERLEETGMEVSDMTKSIGQSDETQGAEPSEINQAEESAEMNLTEQAIQAETKESNDTQLTNESEQSPTEESEDAGQTDSNPEQSETKQLEGQPVEQIEASPQTERTDQTECAKPSTHRQREAEQTASASECEGSLQRHMEETPEQLEGQMQRTGDSEAVEEEVKAAAVPYMNGGGVDRDEARRLAEKLFRLEGIHRTDVVRHLDKE